METRSMGKTREERELGNLTVPKKIQVRIENCRTPIKDLMLRLQQHHNDLALIDSDVDGLSQKALQSQIHQEQDEIRQSWVGQALLDALQAGGDAKVKADQVSQSERDLILIELARGRRCLVERKLRTLHPSGPKHGPLRIALEDEKKIQARAQRQIVEQLMAASIGIRDFEANVIQVNLQELATFQATIVHGVSTSSKDAQINDSLRDKPLDISSDATPLLVRLRAEALASRKPKVQKAVIPHQQHSPSEHVTPQATSHGKGLGHGLWPLSQSAYEQNGAEPQEYQHDGPANCDGTHINTCGIDSFTLPPTNMMQNLTPYQLAHDNMPGSSQHAVPYNNSRLPFSDEFFPRCDYPNDDTMWLDYDAIPKDTYYSTLNQTPTIHRSYASQFNPTTNIPMGQYATQSNTPAWGCHDPWVGLNSHLQQLPSMFGAGNSQKRFFSTSEPQNRNASPRLPKLPKKPHNTPTSSAPTPSPAYRDQSSRIASRRSTPQPLLIISDLNGTLILRKKLTTSFKARPGLSSFLRDLFAPGEQHDSNSNVNQDSSTSGSTMHKFMIWTSAMPATTKAVVPKLLKPEEQSHCIATWSRDTLGLKGNEYRSKAQVYKRMETVWSNAEIQRSHPRHRQGERWSQRNTILIDDSSKKAAAQPFNLIEIPELTTEAFMEEERNGTAVLRQVATYIEEASYHNDVSSFIKTTPFVVDTHWAQTGPQVGRVSAERDVNVDGGIISDDPELQHQSPRK